ncbi:MAG: class I SAM-dependent methyltransferase [Spirochaetes bacterium]|nr:class I SAM-dependent methyltransferase [Spirochaetota bacterium]
MRMIDYWDNLFRNRRTDPSHEACLDEDLPLLKPGRLLDLGAGDGRNAFFFLEKGFEVTCLDYSAEGLASIERKAADCGMPVRTIRADARGDFAALKDERFDTIAMIHFFPGRDALNRLTRLLVEGGTLYCVTFVKDEQDPGSSKYSIGVSRREIAELKLNPGIVADHMRTDERGVLYSFLLRSDRPSEGWICS